MEEKLVNKYLIILGSLTVIILLIIVGYSLLTAPNYHSKSLTLRPVTIQWEVLQLPQLSQLTDFSGIASPTQPMGRDNPLMMGSQNNAQPTK